MGNELPNLEILELSGNEGYGTWPLPCRRDDEVAAVVSVFVVQGQGSLHHEYAPVLLVFAERMATLARRESSPERLHMGLAAVALASVGGDAREALLVLPLLWRSAEVLGLDPRAEFRRASRYLDDPAGLAEFTSRDPEDRSIESMGYVEVDDEFGFHYERTW